MSKKNNSSQITQPKLNSQKNLQKITQMEMSYNGPLPPPALFEEYNKVLPGAAERILSMAEKQAAHRQDLESRAIKSGIKNSLIGLIFGFILGVMTIVGGVYCILKGQPTGGTILSSAGLVSLVSVFVYGSRQRRIERQLKQD